MTIICVDRHLGTMAADGQLSCDGIIIARTHKKIVTVNDLEGRPALCALTGTVLFEVPVRRWYENGAKPEDAPKGDRDNPWHLVVVDQNGVQVYAWDTPYPDPCPTPWAWGSNTELAIALMRSGKSAAEAAKQVCEWSINAGGEIQVVNIAEALGLQMREAAE